GVVLGNEGVDATGAGQADGAARGGGAERAGAGEVAREHAVVLAVAGQGIVVDQVDVGGGVGDPAGGWRGGRRGGGGARAGAGGGRTRKRRRCGDGGLIAQRGVARHVRGDGDDDLEDGRGAGGHRGDGVGDRTAALSQVEGRAAGLRLRDKGGPRRDR